MNSALRQRYVTFAWVAFMWAVGNTAYVYLLLGGEHTSRVESAAYILVVVLLPLVFWHPATLELQTALTPTDNRLLVASALGLWLATLARHLTVPFLSDDYV